jgi:hypothetical protein
LRRAIRFVRSVLPDEATLVLTSIGVATISKLFKNEEPEVVSGMMGLAMLVHVVAIGICWFGNPAGETISDVKVASAHAPIIPRAFKLEDSALIVPDANKFFVEGKDLGSSEPTEERAKQTIFVACEAANWPDPSTAVVLHGTGAEVLGGILQSGATGTYRKMPLTDEMRAEWPEWDGKVEHVVVYDMGRSPRDLVATAGRNYLWMFGLAIGAGLLATIASKKQA